MRNWKPERVWNENVNLTVEEAISFFHAEDNPITDIGEMCEILSHDICNSWQQPYAVSRRLSIAKNLYDYATHYIETKGGFENLELFTAEEVDAIEQEAIENLHDIWED